MKRGIAAAAALLVMLPTLGFGAVWKVDPDHSNVGFKVRHLMVSNVKGVFHKVRGMVKIDEKEITNSSVSATIDTASIDTGVARRDADLKSERFLDVAKYPVMTFVSTKVAKESGNRLKVTGDLTIHGVTRSVVLEVEGPSAGVRDPEGNVRRGASATTKINRKDFGLKWNKAMETGGVLVGDDIIIDLEIEMVQAAQGE